MIDAIQDAVVMILKLMLFSFVHGPVQPNFEVFQSDCPVVLFISWQVKSVVKSLLSLIVKPFITEKSETATDLKNIDLSSDESLRPIKKDAKMGFLGKERIKEVDKKDNVSAKDIRKFCE